MANDKKQNTIISVYLQWSKRITRACVIQWCALAGASLLLVLISLVFHIPLGESLEAVIRSVVTWSSSLAIAGVGSYEVNSIFEKQFRSNLEAEMARLGADTPNEEAGGNG